MTNRQFRILMQVLLYILVAVGLSEEQYTKIHEDTFEAIGKAERLGDIP